MNNSQWNELFASRELIEHDFQKKPLLINSNSIKSKTKFRSSAKLRLLDGHQSRETRPNYFKEKNLFILPLEMGKYAIIQGEGYIDLPTYTGAPINYESKLDFALKSSKIGNSEMQYLDLAYASSVIRTFMEDPSLVLSIRGRKFTPKFNFKAGNHK